MPIIHFKGRLLPELSDFTAKDVPIIGFIEPPYPPALPQGLEIKYWFTIEHSSIDIECEVEPFDDYHFSWIYNRAYATIHTLIDLFSFATGTPLGVIVDSIVYPAGGEKKILISNPYLAGFCTVLTPDKATPAAMNMEKMLPMVVREPELHTSFGQWRRLREAASVIL